MKSLECLTKECTALLHKHKLTKPLIKAELIEHELAKVTIEQKVKEKAIQDFIDKHGLTKKEVYQEWLDKRDLTDKDFENIALRRTKAQELCNSKFSNQLESWFIKRKDDLDIIIYSLIRVKGFYQAKELYLRLEAKEEDFGDVAAKYSNGIEKKTRG